MELEGAPGPNPERRELIGEYSGLDGQVTEIDQFSAARKILDDIQVTGSYQGDVGALMESFAAGFPIIEVQPLLECHVTKVVEAGIWIASELGARGGELIDHVYSAAKRCALSDFGRAMMVDHFLACATAKHHGPSALAIRQIQDTCIAPRRKAFHFISRATSDVLRASQQGDLPDSLRAEVAWILEAEKALGSSDLESRLRSTHPLTQAFALAAIFRSMRSYASLILRAEDSFSLDLRKSVGFEALSLVSLDSELSKLAEPARRKI